MRNVPPGIQVMPGYGGLPGVSVAWLSSSPICGFSVQKIPRHTAGEIQRSIWTYGFGKGGLSTSLLPSAQSAATPPDGLGAFSAVASFALYAAIAGPNCAITASRLNNAAFWRGGGIALVCVL